MRVNTDTSLAPGPYLPSSTVSTQWLADHLGADNLAIVAAANRVRLLSLRLDVAISTIVVYDENIPISVKVFPMGSSHITDDIALGFRISLEEAERVKPHRIFTANLH